MEEKAPDEIVRAHVWVTGRVQGVGFRAFVQQVGAYHRLSGWVRNVGDNQVESVAEGPRKKVEPFVESVKQGPRAARVDNAWVEWEPPQGESSFFRVKF
jgi:acylphosphatase